MSASANPAMAVIMLSYRQGKFIAEALRSVLNQDYSPLEIVVSDDASPDDTWAIIEREMAAYSGAHRVVLNRNQRNLGLIGNLVQAVRLSTAPYLVMAAGDDVSEPGRIKKIAERFAADRTTKFVTSDFRLIDSCGNLEQQALPPWRRSQPITADALADLETGYVQGCVNAYSREVFDTFAPFVPALTFEEDHALPFRALLLGNAAYIRQPLVRYRVHADSITETWKSLDDPLAGFRSATNNVIGFEQKLADLDYLIDRDPDRGEILGAVREKCRCSLAIAKRRLSWEAPGIKGIASLVAGLFSGRISFPLAIKTFLRVNFVKAWARYVRWRM